jgi:hypothetical protein
MQRSSGEQLVLVVNAVTAAGRPHDRTVRLLCTPAVMFRVHSTAQNCTAAGRPQHVLCPLPELQCINFSSLALGYGVPMAVPALTS